MYNSVCQINYMKLYPFFKFCLLNLMVTHKCTRCGSTKFLLSHNFLKRIGSDFVDILCPVCSNRIFKFYI